MPWAAHAAHAVHAAHAAHAANAADAAHAARVAPEASRHQLKLLLLLLLLLLRPRAGCVCQARLSSPHGILGMSIRAGGSHGAATGHPANIGRDLGEYGNGCCGSRTATGQSCQDNRGWALSSSVWGSYGAPRTGVSPLPGLRRPWRGWPSHGLPWRRRSYRAAAASHASAVSSMRLSGTATACRATHHCFCCGFPTAAPAAVPLAFSAYQSLPEQSLAPAVVSRIHVVSALRDRPYRRRDTHVAAAIISRHQA